MFLQANIGIRPNVHVCFSISYLGNVERRNKLIHLKMILSEECFQ